MPSFMDSLISEAVSPMLEEVFGETGGVTLSRGKFVITTSVAASWIGQDDEVVGAEGMTTGVIDRTWLIAKTAYVINGTVTEPRAGDKLTDGDGVAWEVLPIVNRVAAVSYAAGLEWAIRTKRVV